MPNKIKSAIINNPKNITILSISESVVLVIIVFIVYNL